MSMPKTVGWYCQQLLPPPLVSLVGDEWACNRSWFVRHSGLYPVDICPGKIKRSMSAWFAALVRGENNE